MPPGLSRLQVNSKHTESQPGRPEAEGDGVKWSRCEICIRQSVFEKKHEAARPKSLNMFQSCMSCWYFVDLPSTFIPSVFGQRLKCVHSRRAALKCLRLKVLTSCHDETHGNNTKHSCSNPYLKAPQKNGKEQKKDKGNFGIFICENLVFRQAKPMKTLVVPCFSWVWGKP